MTSTSSSALCFASSSVSARTARAVSMIRFSFVGLFFFFGPSRSFPRRITIPLDMARFGFTTIFPLPLGPPAFAAAIRFAALVGFASRMYAERDAARDAAPSAKRPRGCSRICPS